MQPTPEEIIDLRRRHHLTQKDLADSLYHIKVERIADWERGRRVCQPIVYWAMLLTWDKRDLWSEENI